MKKFTLREGVKNVHIKVGDKQLLAHPPSLFPLHFSCAFIGGTNSGKTTAAINLAKAYIDYGSFNHVFLISPTADQNRSFDILHLSPENIYSGQRAQLQPVACIQQVLEKIKAEKQDYDEMKLYTESYKRWVKGNASLEDELTLKLSNYEAPQKNPFPSPLLILDDLSHTSLYSTSRSNAFNNLFLRHRHILDVGLSIFLIVQNFRSGIPKHIRQNIRVYCLWKTHDDTQIKAIFEEVASICTFDKFIEVYQEATETPHHFLLVDLYNEDPRMRFRENFDKILVPSTEIVKKRKYE